MHRFFLPSLNLSTETVTLTDKYELHHMRNVLRLRKKDNVSIFDGKNKEALGRIITITNKSATIEILSAQVINTLQPKIILACAIPKKSKFEWIIEKATELGVAEIIPLKTKRTEIRLKNNRKESKMRRYEQIAINAAKQCKRNTVPKIHIITDLQSVIAYLNKISTIIIPSLIGKPKPLLTALKKFKKQQNISLLIGPEGDFTKNEYLYAKNSACIPVSLGKTILKVETAAITSVAIIQSYFNSIVSQK